MLHLTKINVMEKIKFTPILLIAILSFSLTSCSFFNKVRKIDGYDIKKISLRCDSLLLLPGSSHKIGFVVFTAGNEIFRTTGFLKGTLSWKNFNVEIQNASFNRGSLIIDKNRINRTSSFIPFKISPKHQPEKIFQDTLWLNYEKAIRVFSNNSFKKIPGTKVKFGLQVTYDNNKQQSFESTSALKKILPDYEILTKGGRNVNGEFIVSNNIFDNPDHTPGFLIQLKNDTNVYDILDFQLDYKERYRYYGNGNSGMFGSSGSTGSTGSTGEQGRPGGDGEHGSNGYHGKDIDVFADVYYDSILQSNLIKIFVDNLSTNEQQHYLINPEGGSLYINASGGDGGTGGDGGNGGNGGDGYVGSYYTEYYTEVVIKKDTAGKDIKEEIRKSITKQNKGGDGGYGGHGGFGGAGGNGGNGGSMVVYYTPAMKDYLHLLKLDVSGGSGRSGGSGGSGGRGGSGGSGNPKGRDGGNGQGGMNGPWGYSGYSGNISYIQTNNIPW